MYENDFALIPIETQQQASQLMLETVDTLNNTGIYNFFRENTDFQKIKNIFADYVTNIIIDKEDKKFRESLNFFEKMGFLSNAKIKNHHQRIGIKGGAASFLTNTAFDLLPLIMDEFTKNKKRKEIRTFIIGSLGYINQSPSMLIRRRIEEIHNLLGMKYNDQKVMNIFSEYANQDISKLPYFNSISLEIMYNLFHYVLSVSDLENPKCKERAKEFGDLLRFSNTEINEIENNVEENQELLSDISRFSSISIKTVLKNVVENIDYGEQSAKFVIANDPFKLQQERTIKMTSQILATGALAGLSFFTGPIGDALIIVSTPMINKMINPDMIFSKGILIKKNLGLLRGESNDRFNG